MNNIWFIDSNIFVFYPNNQLYVVILHVLLEEVLINLLINV